MGADLDYALSLADAADELTLARFRAADLRVETKADLTPVTDADRAVERLLRERIARDRPDDGVLGEEEGDDGASSRWIIDPIDGTRNFSRGIPVWGTLIAYERDGLVLCGVASAPALAHRWWAERSGGAFRDGEPMHVSGVSSLADASVAATRAGDLTVLEPLVWHARGFGDFWQHMLVAEGSLDAAVDAHLAVWDYGPLGVIVEEAGGRVTALDGAAPSPGAQVVSSNGVLHARILEALTASAGS